MCFKKKKVEQRVEPPKPGNTEKTQAETPKDVAVTRGQQQQQPRAAQPTEWKQPRRAEKKRDGRRQDDSDNTLEDVPSLMPEIELELLKERDQQITDSQLL